MPFRLSGTLAGHEQDVKAVAAIDNNTFASCSRDSTVRVWSKSNDSDAWSQAASGSADTLIIFHSEGRQFLNALAYLPDFKLIANGGLDGVVNLTAEAPTATPEKILLGHTKNVCSLNYTDGTLVSSSWDCTAIVWDLTTGARKYVLEGHQASVWDAIVLDAANNVYLTASADGTIRQWNRDKEVGQYLGGHTDVVRKLLLLPGGRQFASCSNDGNICIWDIQTKSVVRTLRGHESFIYDLAILENASDSPLLVSSGEDRTVRIWSLGTGEPIQVITLPCISVWTIAVLPNGDIVSGGSDKKIRVFTNSSERVANEFELQEFDSEVQSSTIPEQSMDNLKKTDIPNKRDALAKPGKQEGSTIMVKAEETGIIEAHQWSGGQWVKIGDVVGGTSSGKDKVEYQGASYDYVFDVDIEDGKPPLKLPFNLTDNPYEVAEKFLATNELPSSYTNDVVNFIMQNTQGAQLGGSEAGAGQTGGAPAYADPYADSTYRKKEETTNAGASGAAAAAAAAPAPTTGSIKKAAGSLQVTPQKQHIYFLDFKPTILVKGLTKFNNEVPAEASAHKLTESEISEVSSSIASQTISSKQALWIITAVIPKIMKWPVATSRLIGYDLLRVCIRSVTTVDILQSLDGAQVIQSAINDGLAGIKPEEGYLTLYMMILKVLNNLVGTTLFYQLYFTSAEGSNLLQYSEDFSQLLDTLARISKAFTSFYDHKHYGNTSSALATFIYNLSILQLTNSGLHSSPQSARPIVKFLVSAGDSLVEANSESAYRLVVGYANFKFASVKIEEEPEWVSVCKALYVDSSNEKRFVDLFQDVDKLT